ncbi:MAG: transposase, partial [Aureliella sp.]
MPAATPAFVCSMEAVLDVYARPYDANNPVVGLDESPRQLISELRTGFVCSDGVEHYDYEYRREGVADLCMIIEPLAGRREVLVRDNHDRLSYGRALIYIAEVMYPNAARITIIEDNHSAHKLSALYELLEPERARSIIQRLEIVRTPVHGSWLNVAELEFSVLRRQGLPTRVPSRDDCERLVRLWTEQRNINSKKIDWQFTTADA